MTQQPHLDFSVVIPTYNRAKLLPRALDSILVQSCPAREIIVVDDGSCDGTARLIDEQYPQVRYYYQRHLGVSAARNRGIALAKSRWIALLDSDDTWHPDKMKIQSVAIRDNPSVRLVHTNERWYRNGREIRQKPRHQKYGGAIFEQCLPLCIIAPSSSVIRDDVFADIGVFDESLKACEDYDFWLRFCARESVVLVEQALVTRYAGHGDQLSQRTHSLDHYRIKSLIKLLQSGDLTIQQQRRAKIALQETAHIFINGACKRGNHIGIKYRNILSRLANAAAN